MAGGETHDAGRGRAAAWPGVAFAFLITSKLPGMTGLIWHIRLPLGVETRGRDRTGGSRSPQPDRVQDTWAGRGFTAWTFQFRTISGGFDLMAVPRDISSAICQV